MSLFPAKPSFIVIIAIMTTACASTEERAGGEPGPYEANREEIYSEPTVVSYEEYKDPLQAIKFGRVEDIDYRKGKSNGREIYFNVTGQDASGVNTDMSRTVMGRVYKLELERQ